MKNGNEADVSKPINFLFKDNSKYDKFDTKLNSISLEKQ